MMSQSHTYRSAEADAATGSRRILLATDAWRPQVNGVVRAYEMMVREAAARNVSFETFTPDGFRTWPLPTYPEIRLARVGWRDAAARIAAVSPDHIHIATEGPVGLAMRRACMKHGLAFTSAYHTRFPEYIAARKLAPKWFGYRVQKWFHSVASRIMVPSQSLHDVLVGKGFRNVVVWSRGFDHDRVPAQAALDAIRGEAAEKQPRALYVGRVAVEKNLAAFLSLKLPVHKVVVGGGPQLPALERAYPDVEFTGVLHGDALWHQYARADVFVFPSRTDTLGNVMLEAMAHGVPVAAFPVMGPVDLVTPGVTGILDDDLGAGIDRALQLDRSRVRAHVQDLTWQKSADRFFTTLVPAGPS